MKLKILMSLVNYNMLLTINYYSMIGPMNGVLMILDLQVIAHAQIALLNSTSLRSQKVNQFPECLIYNALCLTSELKITLIHVFSFISLTLL